jgi:hypothetical protein
MFETHCLGCGRKLNNRLSCRDCGQVYCSEVCFRRHLAACPGPARPSPSRPAAGGNSGLATAGLVAGSLVAACCLLSCLISVIVGPPPHRDREPVPLVKAGPKKAEPVPAPKVVRLGAAPVEVAPGEDKPSPQLMAPAYPAPKYFPPSSAKRLRLRNMAVGEVGTLEPSTSIFYYEVAEVLDGEMAVRPVQILDDGRRPDWGDRFILADLDPGEVHKGDRLTLADVYEVVAKRPFGGKTLLVLKTAGVLGEPPQGPQFGQKQAVASATIPATQVGYTPSQGSASSAGGSVQVKGYFRKDGTYVHAHTRAAPGFGHRR